MALGFQLLFGLFALYAAVVWFFDRRERMFDYDIERNSNYRTCRIEEVESRDYLSVGLFECPPLIEPVLTETPVSANTWYSVVGTFDGTDWKLYVNGILKDIETYPAIYDLTFNISDIPLIDLPRSYDEFLT